MRKYFFKTPWIVKKFYPNLIWDKKHKKGNHIYLTFDDGPVPEVTPWVLQELHKRNIEATFFVVGHNVEKHPEIIGELLKAGHKIGNHTYSHLNGWKSEIKTYLESFKACDNIIKSHSKEPNIFRPPYGKLKRSSIHEIKKTHQIIMWDYLAGDFDTTLSSEVILTKALRKVKGGSIVVFHDSIKAEKHLKEILPKFLDHFLELEYLFKTL